jgi:hypothetical protein
MASRLFEITNELVRYPFVYSFESKNILDVQHVSYRLILLSQVLVCMLLMWLLPLLSVIGAVMTLTAAALAAVVLTLCFRASSPASFLR